MKTNANVVAEDDIVPPQSVLNRLAFRTYEPHVVELGTKLYPLNVLEK